MRFNYKTMIEDPEQREKLKLAQEAIAFQNADKFIEEASSLIADIRGHVEDLKIKNSNKINKDILIPLALCFNNRFGPRFVVDTNNFTNAFTLISHPSIDRVNDLFSFKSADDMLKMTSSKELEKAMDTRQQMEDALEGSIDEPRSYKEYETKELAILYSLVNRAKVMVEDGIQINLKNGTIEGKIAKDCFFYVNADFVAFFNYGLTDTEILAILLHEIGHNFFELERAGKIYADIFLLADVIKENYAKAPAETIKIFYKRSGLDKDPDLKNDEKNMSVIILTATTDILRGRLVNKKDRRIGTINEQEADEFAGRFGLGAELASGLSKFTNNGIDVSGNRILGFDIFLGIHIAAYWIIASWSLAAAAIAFIAVVFGFLFLRVFIDALFRFENDNGYPYDTYIRRLQRARNTSVRYLAAINDKKAKDKMLLKIANLDKTIELAKKSEPILETVADNLGKVFHPGSYSAVRYSEIIETMMANDLIVASNKIRSLG